MLRTTVPVLLIIALGTPSVAWAQEEHLSGGFVVELPGAERERPAVGFVLTEPVAARQQVTAAALPALEIPPFCCNERKFWIAASELLMLEVIPWYFNRHVADDPTAVLSFESWVDNLEQGFEWDANDFHTNMFMHPFHGSLYFNAARSNGYDYWESAAFAWAGSMLWEMFGENNRGAINDWASTSMGGMAIGEAFHRSAKAIRDNEATGVERAGRELASFVVDPVGGINRLFRGEASRVGDNPEDRFPGSSRTVFRMGVSSLGSDDEADAGDVEAGSGFFETDIYYGDILSEHKHEPFDTFEMRLQLNQSGERALSRLQIEGVLSTSRYHDEEGSKHIFALTQHYDYIDTPSFEFGGQSLSTSFHTLFPLAKRWSFYGRAQPTAALIWGVSSDYDTVFVPDHGSGTGSGSGSGSGDTEARSYDFGSGAGFRGRAILRHDRDDIIELYYLFNWSHTLNGAAGNHVVQFFGARAQIPVFGAFGAGIDYLVSARQSYYRDFDDVQTDDWQLRIFLGLF